MWVSSYHFSTIQICSGLNRKYNMVMAETGSGDSNYHEYIENVYVLSETLDGYVFKLSGDISKNEMIQLANSLTLVNEGDLY